MSQTHLASIGGALRGITPSKSGSALPESKGEHGDDTPIRCRQQRPLLAQFSAFSFAPAWPVGLLQGTQPSWTLGMGYLILRQEEHIDAGQVTSILLVVAGIVVISLQI